MNTWGSVRRWRAEPLEQLVSRLNQDYQRIVGFQDELRTAATPKGWTGTAADAAREEATRLYNDVEALVAELGSLRRAAGGTADRIPGIGNAIEEAESLAKARVRDQRPRRHRRRGTAPRRAGR